MENDLASPGMGRIKPFHNDMFAVGIIATKLFDDLGYYAMDGGLGQAAGVNPTKAGGSENSAVHLGLFFWRGVSLRSFGWRSRLAELLVEKRCFTR